MNVTITARIAALRRMTVAELQGEWLRHYGEPTRSRNKQFLFRRLAWRVQELAHGGLSDASKQRIDALASDDFVRARTPAQGALAAARARHGLHGDPRRPSLGTVIVKRYKHRELRVVVREDGLELGGTMYATATALAKAVTGSRSINGNLFLGITKRKRN